MMSDCTIVTSRQHLYQTIVQVDKTIVLPRKLATGSIHDYLFCYCPLVGILFEVLRIGHVFVVDPPCFGFVVSHGTQLDKVISRINRR